MQMKDVTSTSFGLVIAFLLPGIVALYSLVYWSSSASRAFTTFLTANSNVGLFLLLILGALIFGLVISAVRWLIYEVVLGLVGLYGPRVTPEERQRMSEEPRFAAYRAAIDEAYRYAQCFGGLTIAAPGLFVGWLGSLDDDAPPQELLIAAFVVLEVLLVARTITMFRSYRAYERAILA